jgi:hypothetical protein
MHSCTCTYELEATHRSNFSPRPQVTHTAHPLHLETRTSTGDKIGPSETVRASARSILFYLWHVHIYCWSCSNFTARYRPGFWRSEAEARRCRRVRYIYTLARVSWRLDSLVSRHRRVTQNSWDREIVTGWCPWFSPSHWRGFSR